MTTLNPSDFQTAGGYKLAVELLAELKFTTWDEFATWRANYNLYIALVGHTIGEKPTMDELYTDGITIENLLYSGEKETASW